MQTQTITQFDLSVFETDFDPHKKGKQCKRLIFLIQENKPDPLNQKQFNKNPLKSRVLSEENKTVLLDFIANLLSRVKPAETIIQLLGQVKADFSARQQADSDYSLHVLTIRIRGMSIYSLYAGYFSAISLVICGSQTCSILKPAKISAFRYSLVLW